MARLQTLTCSDPYCWCLSDGHKCRCRARGVDDCMCSTCEVCGRLGPDAVVGVEDGDLRILCSNLKGDGWVGCAEKPRA
jgi:hypothetical protein